MSLCGSCQNGLHDACTGRHVPSNSGAWEDCTCSLHRENGPYSGRSVTVAGDVPIQSTVRLDDVVGRLNATLSRQMWAQTGTRPSPEQLRDVVTTLPGDEQVEWFRRQIAMVEELATVRQGHMELQERSRQMRNELDRYARMERTHSRIPRKPRTARCNICRCDIVNGGSGWVHVANEDLSGHGAVPMEGAVRW